MTTIRTVSSNNLKVWLGDGNDPETFAWVAAFTDKSFKRKAAAGSTNVPDDTDPSAPMVEEGEITVLSYEVSGSGVTNVANVLVWDAWHRSGKAKNIRVERATAGADGGGYEAFAALLTDFTETGKKGEKVTMSVTIQSTGASTFTANP